MTAELWAVVIPLIAIDLGLMAYVLLDLCRRTATEVVGGHRGIWLAILLVLSTVGPLAYLFAGRCQQRPRPSSARSSRSATTASSSPPPVCTSSTVRWSSTGPAS